MPRYDRINQTRRHKDTMLSEIVKPELSPPSKDIEPNPRSTFNPEYVHIARVMIEAGSKYSDLARAFNVSMKIIKVWMKNYPIFKEAIVEAQDWFNTQLAETALVKRATGYNYIEDTHEQIQIDSRIIDLVTDLEISKTDFVIMKQDEGAKKAKARVRFEPVMGMVLTKRVKKSVAPSERAIEYFLNNRSRFMPDKDGNVRWAHTNKLEVTGADGKDLIPDSISPEKLLAELISIQQKNDDTIEAEIVEAKRIGIDTSEESHNEADVPDAR